MVKYVSAKGNAENPLKEIAPDFNNKLSSILKKASQPTWDLEEIKDKKPEETDLVYFDIGLDSDTEYEWVPIQSTVKMYYRGITDTDKIFYVDIVKTMVVRYMENWKSLLGNGFEEVEVTAEDGGDGKSTYISVGIIEDEDRETEIEDVDGEWTPALKQVTDYIKDWNDWVDAPNVPAQLVLQYNDGNIKKSCEVPVDKIDNAIQKFVDTYIDV